MKVLLAAADLPTAGLAGCWATTLVAVEAMTVVGSAAVELHGSDGVLRSLCVVPLRRGERLGERLVSEVMGLARQHGLARLYLLTETAADFFPRFGFALVARDSVPDRVRDSIEFSSLCPASATAMVARIEGSGGRVSRFQGRVSGQNY